MLSMDVNFYMPLDTSETDAISHIRGSLSAVGFNIISVRHDSGTETGQKFVAAVEDTSPQGISDFLNVTGNTR